MSRRARTPGSITLWDAAKAFPAMLGRKETWLPHRNPYWPFGFCWGLPVPLATLAVECAARGNPITPANMWSALLANPWQWYFAAHPLLFGVVFGAVGSMALQRGARIEQLVDALQLRADTDGLTGLLNHRAFQSRLREEYSRARRSGDTISLLMIDLDHFKRLNDEFGHPSGDAVLRQIAERLRGSVREYDLPARYGGEEFAVILPGMDAPAADAAAERVREEVAARPFDLPGGRQARVTVSVGAAALNGDLDVIGWLELADSRLYKAKKSGRNRVCGSSNSPSSGGDSPIGA